MDRKRPILLLLSVLILLVLAGIAFLLLGEKPHGVQITNLTGARLFGVKLELLDTRTENVLHMTKVDLEDGEEFGFDHPESVFVARLRFVLDGRLCSHQEPRVELNSGDDWGFQIQPSGAVQFMQGALDKTDPIHDKTNIKP